MPNETNIIDPLLLTIDVAANKLGNERSRNAPRRSMRQGPGTRSDRPKCTLAKSAELSHG